jgi:hypothetical protein
MVPAVILALGLLFGEAEGVSIQIGVYGDGGNLFDGAAASEDWTVVRYEDRGMLRRDVANRRLELGYVFEEGGITLYTSPATVTERVSNLLAAAGHLSSISGKTGAEVLRLYGIDADAADIQASADAYLADGPLMERLVLTYGGPADGLVNDSLPAPEAAVPYRRLFHGMMALFAQLLAMLCAMGLSGKAERDIIKRVKAAGRGKLYLLSGLAAVFFMTGAVLAVTAFAGALMFPGVWLMQDALPALLYLLTVSSAAVILAVLLPEGAYPGVITMGFIFTALMGGVIFDLREVFEGVGFLRFLFPSHYYMMGL